jgi:Ca-activated chloride channel family protein
VPRAGTDLATPLELALKNFQENEKAPGKQHAKIVVLISDGEDFGESLKKPLRQLEQANVQVFTLGIGTSEGGPIPFANGFKRDENGKKIITKLNLDALQEIASRTNGQYFEINDRSSEISKLISAINNVKGQVLQSHTIDVKANKYFYPLLAALLLILFDVAVRFNTFRI